MTSGKSTVNGSVALVEDEPFLIENMSLQDNILFGLQLFQSRLSEAIQVAQLTSDLELLPDGLATTCTGAQSQYTDQFKLKLSLARAIYSNADIILLDDPLSSLDADTKSKIQRVCIQDFFKSRLVIMTSRKLESLEMFKQIVHLEKGEIKFCGTQAELRDSGFASKILDADSVLKK